MADLIIFSIVSLGISTFTVGNQHIETYFSLGPLCRCLCRCPGPWLLALGSGFRANISFRVAVLLLLLLLLLTMTGSGSQVGLVSVRWLPGCLAAWLAHNLKLEYCGI